MKILVTGASGNVGAYVVKELVKMGEEVVAAGTDKMKLEKMFGQEIVTAVLDFTRQETYSDALKGVDRLFLMRPPHLGKPEDLYPFIDYLKTCDIRLISFLSLMGAEKNTNPPHHKIEKHIEHSGIPYAHIRPGFFMQNLSGIHSVEIREHDEILVPAGNSRTSFIDARDIGLSVATVLHEPDKYNKPGFLKYRNHYIKKRGLDKSYVNVTLALYFMTRLGTAEKITKEFIEITGKKPRTFREFAENHTECFS